MRVRRCSNPFYRRDRSSTRSSQKARRARHTIQPELRFHSAGWTRLQGVFVRCDSGAANPSGPCKEKRCSTSTMTITFSECTCSGGPFGLRLRCLSSSPSSRNEGRTDKSIGEILRQKSPPNDAHYAAGSRTALATSGQAAQNGEAPGELADAGNPLPGSRADTTTRAAHASRDGARVCSVARLKVVCVTQLAPQLLDNRPVVVRSFVAALAFEIRVVVALGTSKRVTRVVYCRATSHPCQATEVR